MTESAKQKDTLLVESLAGLSLAPSPPDQPSAIKDETKGEDARARILDAAQNLFAAHGFSATTVKAIAQQAEVPVGLIFYYFSSKKTLLESVIQERSILAGLRAAVETLVVADPRTALRTLGLRYLTLLKQHEELAAIQLREFRSHPEVAAQLRALREEHVQLISSYIQKVLLAAQCEPPRNIQVIARIFLYNILEIVMIEDLPDPSGFIEDMADVLLCAITKQA